MRTDGCIHTPHGVSGHEEWCGDATPAMRLSRVVDTEISGSAIPLCGGATDEPWPGWCCDTGHLRDMLTGAERSCRSIASFAGTRPAVGIRGGIGGRADGNAVATGAGTRGWQSSGMSARDQSGAAPTLTGLGDSPEICQSSEACLVSLRCISTLLPPSPEGGTDFRSCETLRQAPIRFH